MAVVRLSSKGAFVAASIIAMRDLAAGHAVSVSSVADVNGVGRLRVDYCSHEAAVRGIERTLQDAGEDHADTWSHCIDHSGAWISVVYAWGLDDTEDEVN